MIDITFDFHADSYGKDPDVYSPTLKKYHRILWSKSLPNGKIFNLRDNKAGAYLYHKSELGQFFLGSDAITHSYKHHKRKQWLTRQIPEAVNQVYCAGSTIGAYIIFPNNKINNKQTINGARGCNGKIDDSVDSVNTSSSLAKDVKELFRITVDTQGRCTLCETNGKMDWQIITHNNDWGLLCSSCGLELQKQFVE